jgi:hypothetical protein
MVKRNSKVISRTGLEFYKAEQYFMTPLILDHLQLDFSLNSMGIILDSKQTLANLQIDPIINNSSPKFLYFLSWNW